MEVIAGWFAGVWPIVGHYSFWAVSMVACGAIVWLRPALWKPVAWVAGIITAGTVCYGVGVYDGEKHAHAQCEVEKQVAVEYAKRARVKAKRSLARQPSRWLPNNPRRDPDCRDC